MSDNLVPTLQKLLRQLFQINEETADLDFGIYRVMHLKKDAVEAFIQEDIAQVADIATLKEAVAILAQELGVDLECAEADLECAQRIQPAKADLFRVKRDLLQRVTAVGNAGCNEVFNHLVSFFSRYYDEGDFMPLPRASSSSTYAVPYNGEEVMLHWANKDQYYIKTGEHFQNYLFRIGDYTVRFRLKDAETEQNNTRDERRYFILHPANPLEYDEITKTLTIWFEYRQISKEEGEALGSKPQAKLVEQAYSAVCTWDGIALTGLQNALCQSPGKGQKSLLERNLAQYVRRNTSDFFIHKNLEQFLRRELDFYIKNEMMNLDVLGTDADLQPIVDRIRVTKYLANQIIAFLVQLENFQKMLWEKKKFVLQTDYCMTLDHIPEVHYQTICANERQVEEWKTLYGIGEGGQQTLGGNTIDLDFLKTHPYLVLDTAFFDAAFKDRIIEDLQNPDGTPVQDLDVTIGGLMVRSENWQALNLLQERYREHVKCIYIDPPYNTGNDEFLYKDNYQHSSWLSMMSNRLYFVKNYLASNGTISISIDDHEDHQLRQLIENECPFLYYINKISVKTKPAAGASGGGEDKRLKKNIEYVLTYTKDFDEFKGLYHLKEGVDLFELIEEMKWSGKSWKYTNILLEKGEPLEERTIFDGAGDEIKVTKYRGLRRKSINQLSRSEQVEDEKTIYLRNFNKIFSDTNAQSSIRTRIIAEFQSLNDNELLEVKYRPKTGKDKGSLVTHYYISPTIRRLIWLKDTAELNGNQIIKYERLGTLWQDLNWNNISKEGDTKFQNGKKPVNLVIKCLKYLQDDSGVVLDFFAGSGTTAHATLQYNAEEGGDRKYILVEIGDSFKVNILKRIKKVMFSRTWTGGKPSSQEGFSHVFKYCELEQYGDTLNNIEFSSNGSVQKSLFDLDGYFLRYMLDVESRGSPCRMNHSTLDRPFDYTLARRTASQDGPTQMPVDLVETFNYLLGIHVTTLRTAYNGDIKYRVVTGEKANKNGMETYLIIWRTTAGWGEAEWISDREFVTENIMCGWTFDHIYMNDRSMVEKAQRIEDSFHRLMEGGWDVIRPTA